jgi:hypothetical protein
VSFRDSGGIIVVAKGGLYAMLLSLNLLRSTYPSSTLYCPSGYLAGIALRARRGPNDNIKAAIFMRHFGHPRYVICLRCRSSNVAREARYVFIKRYDISPPHLIEHDRRNSWGLPRHLSGTAD